jgi:hypothetical protein
VSLILYHILVIQKAVIAEWISLSIFNLLEDLFVDQIHHCLLSLLFVAEKFFHWNQHIINAPFENHLALLDLFIQKITCVEEH